jgi:hypothetical protein
MATVVYESIESRNISTSNGSNSGRRVFHVWDDAVALTDPISVLALLGTAGLPARGDQWPNALTPFVAVDRSVSRVDGQNDVWRVEWNYKDGVVGGLTQPKEPSEPGFVEISANGTAEFSDGWRSLTGSQLSTLVLSGGTYAFGTPAGTTDDIAGTSIDIAGFPTSFLRKKVRLRVSETIGNSPQMGFYMQFVGRRNNVPFAGAAVGLVLYVSPDVDRIERNVWRVTHTFELDNFYHMIQTPERNPDGSIKLASGVADNVFFRQPFPDFANFYAISPNLPGSGVV